MSALDKIKSLGRQLYPTGRAFKMPPGGFFEKLNSGLADSEARAFDDALSIYNSALPDNPSFTTDDASMWERRLGLITNTSISLNDRKLAIQRKMQHPGNIKARQHYLFIQRELLATGFEDVVVTENRFLESIGFGTINLNGVVRTPAWETQSSATDNNWNSVTYGNGLFVAVAGTGTGNRVMTSPDGITWTSRTSAADNNWQSVVWSPTLRIFVAVSDSGSTNRVMTSPDGITWTLRNSAENTDFRSVAYGNGIFAAVGSVVALEQPVIISSNGISWSGHAIGTISGNLRGITFAKGIFVAVGNDLIYTSSNGTTWTTRTAPGSFDWQSVTYGKGLFVAVSNNGATTRVMTSPDGITWTLRNSAADNDWTSVTYGNGRFVAVANTGTLNRVMISEDGINWTLQANETDNEWQGVTYANGLFVAVSQTGTGTRTMLYDLNQYNICVNHIDEEIDSIFFIDPINLRNVFYISGGITNNFTWTSRTSATDNNWNSVTYGNGLFVAVAGTGTGNRVMTSPDGITWTSRTSAADNNWRSVIYGNGLFVAVSSTGTGNRVMTSPDGITWTSRTSAADNNWESVTYGEGLFVAVATTGASSVMTSPDGITWTLRITPTTGNCITYAVVNRVGIFVSVSNTQLGDQVMTSPDGITWTLRNSPAAFFTSIAFGNKTFVSVASGGQVMTSPDGITWTSRTASVANSWSGVTYGNGLFVAVAETGTGNRVMTSPDGITWTSRTSAADNDWNGVGYHDGLFVAVSFTGTGNRVMTSYSLTVSNVDIDANRKDEFRELILKTKPRQQAAFLFINYI